MKSIIFLITTFPWADLCLNHIFETKQIFYLSKCLPVIFTFILASPNGQSHCTVSHLVSIYVTSRNNLGQINSQCRKIPPSPIIPGSSIFPLFLSITETWHIHGSSHFSFNLLICAFCYLFFLISSPNIHYCHCNHLIGPLILISSTNHDFD